MKNHYLYEINLERKTAFCTVCGHTQVHVRKTRTRTTPEVICIFRAKEKRLDSIAKYKRSLNEKGAKDIKSELGLPGQSIGKNPEEKKGLVKENIRLMYEFMRRQKCKRCGVWATDPEGFKFFEMHLPREQKITTLYRTATTECLQKELENRDLYCKKCFHIVHSAYSRNTSVPPVEPFTVI